MGAKISITGDSAEIVAAKTEFYKYKVFGPAWEGNRRQFPGETRLDFEDIPESAWPKFKEVCRKYGLTPTFYRTISGKYLHN